MSVVQLASFAEVDEILHSSLYFIYDYGGLLMAYANQASGSFYQLPRRKWDAWLTRLSPCASFNPTTRAQGAIC